MTTPRIDQLVKHAGRSLLLAESAGHALCALGVAIVALAAAVLIDAGYALPGFGLLILDMALLLVMALALRPLVARLWRGRFGDRQTAVHVENRMRIPDNQLINALDLARQDAAGTSASLRAQAIALGESAALEVQGRSVIDREALNRAIKRASAAVIGLLLAYLLIPSAFHAVLPRLVSPFADHPPFTLVKFDIHTDPEPVYYGKPTTIRVALSGPNVPKQAHVVFIDDGVKSLPLPMHRTQPSKQDEAATDSAVHFAMRIERVESLRRFYITTPKGRSALHTLAADTSPLFELVGAGHDYPDYTGWPDTNGPLSSSGIRALAGTHVTLRIESNVPLSGGALKLIHEEDATATSGRTHTLTPNPADPRSASVRFQLDMPGRFELTLLGADGKPGVEPLQGELSALPDRAPKIDIVHPERQAVVPEGWQVDVEVSAGDDIGLSTIVMHAGLNDTPTSPTVLPMKYTDINRTVAQSGYTFDPTQLGALAGDTLRYYATVRDNRPVAPQSAETPVHAIHIITMQQYLDLARTQYRIDDLNREFDMFLERLAFMEAQRNQLLNELAELQRLLGTGEPLTDEQRQAIADLESALAEYAQEASVLADELTERAEQATLYDFEDRYKQMLSELGSQLGAQSDQAQSLASALEALQQDDAPAQRRAAGLQAERFAMLDDPFAGGMREQTDMAEQDLEKLRLAEAMLAQGERIRRVAQEQDELAVRLSGLSEPRALSTEEQARAGLLAREQARLRDELSEAHEALLVAAEQAREVLPNMSRGAMSVVDKIENLRIVPTQTAAQKASLAGNGPLAHQAAREAADKLDSLLSDVAQAQAQAGGDLDGCFLLPRQQIQSALQQMAAGRGLPGMGTQGGSGVGMSGASARMSMMGPAVPGQPGGDSLAKAGRRGGRGGRGRIVSGAEDADAAAEVIHADASQHTSRVVSQFPGVPAEYREQAEAYFKRIAEEQR